MGQPYHIIFGIVDMLAKIIRQIIRVSSLVLIVFLHNALQLPIFTILTYYTSGCMYIINSMFNILGNIIRHAILVMVLVTHHAIVPVTAILARFINHAQVTILAVINPTMYGIHRIRDRKVEPLSNSDPKAGVNSSPSEGPNCDAHADANTNTNAGIKANTTAGSIRETSSSIDIGRPSCP
ncbi:hypothetical protein QBC39DRAFT_332968 [Podospora conica]|nr:hypothetical protein QBC39DRAFT_332968 [Schizothecium conicum]